MTLVVAPVYDNPATPGDFAQAYFPDQLIAGGSMYVTQPIVLAAGTLPRGSVLGKQTNFSIIATANGAGTNGANTGTGTVGSYISEPGRDFGNYVVLFTGTGSTAAFSVTDPEGNSLGTGNVGTAFVGSFGGSAEIGFTITNGGTNFIVGDGFLLNQIQSTGNYILSLTGASDGSQTPVAILADAADASLGPVRTGAYLFGEFNQNAVSYDSSWSLPALASAMRAFGIFLKFVNSASDPT
jgi:head decoration protein D